MYQTTSNAKPEAFITRKKSRAKIYQNNNLYFNDGEVFEIELFNPKTNRVLAKIWLNGEEISGSGIIVNPGQRIFLERFFDSKNKFVYKTYEVENTDISLAAIRNNGYVEVRFYNEYFPVFKSNITYYGNYGILTNNNSGNLFNLTIPTYGTSNNSNVASSFSVSNNSIETGRIEKGEDSNQSFETSYGTFDYFSISEFKYKILPMSVKSFEIADLKKYCTECGKKVKESFKYCPSCGNKV